MAVYEPNDPGKDPLEEWLRRSAVGGTQQWLGNAGRGAAGMGRGALDFLNPAEQRDAVDIQGNPVVGPRRRATETALPFRGALGQSGVPTPGPEFQVPGFQMPLIRGQQKALNRSDSLDTPTPVKVAFDAKAMQEDATKAAPGQTQGGSNGLTSGPAPVDESQDHAATTGLTQGRKSLYDIIGLNEEGKSRPEPESYIRAIFPGETEWVEQAPRHPDDSRGRSEMDWSKVANPMAFEDYRERGARKLADMQAEDPFVIEREKSRIEDDKANRDAARKVGIYGHQKDIDIQNEEGRRSRYEAIYAAKAADLDALRESPEYRAKSEEARQRAEGVIDARYAAQIAAMDKAASNKREVVGGETS